jgi:hypothetical protein
MPKQISTDDWWTKNERRWSRGGASKNPHPLEPIVLQFFAENDHQDLSTVEYRLAGANVRGAGNAYRTVAMDVLGCMAHQGKLCRDEYGWLHW